MSDLDIDAVQEDEFEHYNYVQEKYASTHGGKNRSKKEAEKNTNRHNPGGHERKIVTKLMNTEKNHQKANTSSKDKEEKSI